MVGRINKVKDLRLGDTILNLRKAGLSYRQISEKIKRDTGHTVSRQIVGRWVAQHSNIQPNVSKDDYFEKFREFYYKFNRHMCPRCREWVLVACMSDNDIKEFKYKVDKARDNRTYDSQMKRTVRMIKELHGIDI